jgi:DNA polymerase-3 subunit epsilon
MSDALFDFDEPDPSPSASELPVREGQVVQIRREFERLGITGQEERQAVIESTVLRSVRSLSSLTALEARRILAILGKRMPGGQNVSGSSWDNREEDTWIDKL